MKRKTLAEKKESENNFYMEEIWNMDSTLSSYIVQGLRAFKNHDKHGYPGGFANMDEWNETIQKMINAFKLLENYRAFSDDEEQTIEDGLDLFREYFRNLWV